MPNFVCLCSYLSSSDTPSGLMAEAAGGGAEGGSFTVDGKKGIPAKGPYAGGLRMEKKQPGPWARAGGAHGWSHQACDFGEEVPLAPCVLNAIVFSS